MAETGFLQSELVPESVAPLWVLPGVVASCSSRGSSPREKDVLLGSPSPDVSSPSLSAEMASLGSRLGRGPWLTPSVSVDWDSDGLEQRGWREVKINSDLLHG